MNNTGGSFKSMGSSPVKHEGTHPGPGKPGDKGYHEGHMSKTVEPKSNPNATTKPEQMKRELGVKAEQGDSMAILTKKFMSGKTLTDSDIKYIEKNSPVKHKGTHPGPGKKGDKGYHAGHMSKTVTAKVSNAAAAGLGAAAGSAQAKKDFETKTESTTPSGATKEYKAAYDAMSIKLTGNKQD